MSNFKYYPEPFDLNSPPPPPPNRDMTRWPFAGWIETKQSKKRTREYIDRSREYVSGLMNRK